ncbi:hypothetical protein M5W68_16330 [Paenibacillus larvae]|uniref:hypothetical protein n=1 Tax=Paenibacillus larvae TaxID=1464 RepID=UPI0022828A3F|nr:hypothetical protein [Paenibacillus larvae]MCY9512132.1 hypothetical protein [Paenibacillus larvae]MCY9526638.1 hypothetical protein [Paenibacillus larvae]
MGNVKYREVDRAAKVGERIRIVDADPLPTQKKYSNGDEFLVEKAVNFGVVVERGGLDFYKREYVVLEPIAESDEISDIKNEMERLTGELATLALRVSKLEEPKSPQVIRDEIVEKVKADRGTLATRFCGGKLEYTITAPNPPLATYAEFIINRKKRTVVCILRDLGRNKVCSRGIAKCAPGDVFNSHIGRAIALRRALGLKVPAEYLSVPNPTEFKVGDIVIRYTWVNTMHPYYTFQIGTETDGKSVLSLDSIDSYCTLIDDSHEEGALDAYLA